MKTTRDIAKATASRRQSSLLIASNCVTPFRRLCRTRNHTSAARGRLPGNPNRVVACLYFFCISRKQRSTRSSCARQRRRIKTEERKRDIRYTYSSTFERLYNGVAKYFLAFFSPFNISIHTGVRLSAHLPYRHRPRISPPFDFFRLRYLSLAGARIVARN